MDTMGIIFSNIYDSNMGELTSVRTSASIPFGGRYRQVDFILSNMTNSGIRDVGIITKYNYQSLMEHLGSCEEWDVKLGDNVRFLPPYATGHTGAYKGKLEALQTALPVLNRNTCEYVVLADSSVLCAINFRKVVEDHISSGADVTVVAKAGIADGKRKLSLAVHTDKGGKLDDLATDYVAPKGYLAGMSMFIMRRESLITLIGEMVPHGKYHFERDFLLSFWNEKKLNINVYPFENVVLFNGSVEEYYHNSMELLKEPVRRGLFRTEMPIYTKVRDAVPTLFGERGSAADCVIADGCRIDGTAERSVIFREVTISEGAEVKNSVIMQGSKIGKGAKLQYVILDKNVCIGDGATLLGSPDHPQLISKGSKIERG